MPAQTDGAGRDTDWAVDLTMAGLTVGLCYAVLDPRAQLGGDGQG